MIAKELESLIKNTLKGYAMDYNRVNPKNKIDFNLTFTLHRFDVKELKGYDKKDEKFDRARKMDGESLHYLRLSKTLVDTKEKRVIFTAHRGMLMECVKQMMIGGLEYSEAIYRMKVAEDAQKENQKEPQAHPKGAAV